MEKTSKTTARKVGTEKEFRVTVKHGQVQASALVGSAARYSGKKTDPSHKYYVWVLDLAGKPMFDEGPHGPMSLESAKGYARIAATTGFYSRAVSFGKSIGSGTFDIVRIYERKTGKRLL
jgi:hypothetical protein